MSWFKWYKLYCGSIGPYIYTVSKKNVPSLTGLVHQFVELLARVINRHSKLDFLNYLTFYLLYLALKWSDRNDTFPRHCYSVTGALCKHGF